jgi:hypothetical protein
MQQTTLPSFAELRRRYSTADNGSDESPQIISFGSSLRAADDPAQVLQYLAGLGVSVSTLDELHDGINELADEEELSAFRCREGVAVSHASDGWWMLFVDDGTALLTSSDISGD